MDIIKQIESNGNPSAFNERSGARGICQITWIVLKEWNIYHPDQEYNLIDLYNPAINETIAEWFMFVRVPEMLKHYKKPLTLENMLISYHAGIAFVVHGYDLPKETVEYIEKYHKLGGTK